MDVNALSVVLIATVMAGCATPVVKLRNNAGRVVRCSGGAQFSRSHYVPRPHRPQ